ncbi:MAG: PilZ domain-containing protein [Omnitrophica bacterium]|nr:PilZ domain-containing protein [Candidatus Omnitrophota bacterium]
MIPFQIGLIIFLIFILAIVYQDERRKRGSSRKSARLSKLWHDDKDRRKDTRINTKIDVLYEVSSGSTIRKRASMSRNISLGGVNLALNEKLLPGTRLSLQLNIPKKTKPLFTDGEIVWVKEVTEKSPEQKEQRLFATGIKFIYINPADKTMLHSFINQKVKNAPE